MAKFIEIDTDGGTRLINIDQVVYADIGKDYANVTFAFTGEWTEEGAREFTQCLRGESLKRFLEASQPGSASEPK